MASVLAAKRMARERKNLERQNEDYIVHFDDENDNLFKFDAYVLGPRDTLYSFKFVKLRFEIPHEYPLKPPKCKFIQHSGGRIHPNLYVEGKVCLSILGTWEGEPWATAMTCETVLITIRSLLDNKPYTHEPGQRDDPSYNKYVQYGTWRWLLLDYYRHERVPKLKLFLQRFLVANEDALMAEFGRQVIKNAGMVRLSCLYGGPHLVVDYSVLKRDLEKVVEEAKGVVAVEDAEVKVKAGRVEVEVVDLVDAGE